MTHAHATGTGGDNDVLVEGGPEDSQGDTKATTGAKIREGAQVTHEVLKDPEASGKIKAGLVKAGSYLRERAETAKTRQALAQKLLDELTPEAQREFIENTQSFVHTMIEGFKNQTTVGIRGIWKALAPTLLPEDWVTLKTFSEDELKAYIGLGAVHVDESIAKLVDSELKDKAHFLQVLGFLAEFIPAIGPELGEVISGIGHLAEAPGEYLEHVLPEVRAEVRHGAEVRAQQRATQEAVKAVA